MSLHSGRTAVRSLQPAHADVSIVSRTTQDGALRSDLSDRDIVLALIRFARPLAAGLPSSEERALAHRHLDFYIDGLRAGQRRQTVLMALEISPPSLNDRTV